MTDWGNLIEELESSIKSGLANEKTLKHLWYVPEENASQGRYNGVMFLGLNSGGDDVRDRDIYEKYEGVSSWYHDDDWGSDDGESSLQLQIRLLFLYLYHAHNNAMFNYDLGLSKIDNIKKEEEKVGYEKFLEGVLGGNVCPFQSSSMWNLLYPWAFQRSYLIDFWRSIFYDHLRNETRVVVVMGNDAFDIIKKALNIKVEAKYYPSGWGKVKIGYVQGVRGEHPSIIELPHLSRFAIFGREKSLKNVEDIFHRRELFNY